MYAYLKEKRKTPNKISGMQTIALIAASRFYVVMIRVALDGGVQQEPFE